MLSIAIVEDDPRESSSLKQKLESVFAPRQIEAKIEIFENPLVFLPRYTAQYDIMFFDIEMPEIDGVSATKKIREIDDKVMIIFVTAMGQLAAEGYSVEAFDFLVKPVPVSMLETTIDRTKHTNIVVRETHLRYTFFAENVSQFTLYL